jgi:hypothetical protein
VTENMWPMIKIILSKLTVSSQPGTSLWDMPHSCRKQPSSIRVDGESPKVWYWKSRFWSKSAVKISIYLLFSEITNPDWRDPSERLTPGHSAKVLVHSKQRSNSSWILVRATIWNWNFAPYPSKTGKLPDPQRHLEDIKTITIMLVSDVHLEKPDLLITKTDEGISIR